MILASWRDGWQRVLRAPALLAGVFAATLLGALPLAIAMRSLIEAHLGSSLMANQASMGMNWDWWQEFAAQTSGLGSAFIPSIIGFAPTLHSISSVLDRQREILPVTIAVAVYLLVWTFLAGGLLDRYARQRPTRAYGFFAASGVFFWRFLRLAIVAGLAYGLLFWYVHEWLFADLYDWLTLDVDVERTAFAWRMGLYALFGALLVATNIVVDYAKVRMVVEDRRSALLAVLAAIGFIRRNTRAALGLYGLNSLSFLLLLAVWFLAAPGAAGGGLWVWIAAAATQLYILARLALKLQFMASQTALFQSRLAHAAYAAAPPPVWPESAAAELIVDRTAT